MKYLTAGLLVLWAGGVFAGTTPEYKRLNPSCGTCAEIDKLLSRHSVESSPDKQLVIALKIAGVIKKITLKGKIELEQRRAIYFAINATNEVLEDDFDSETVVVLMDLRSQAPEAFDYILWRFPIGNQTRIIERMQALKDDGIRPKNEIPTARAIDS